MKEVGIIGLIGFALQFLLQLLAEYRKATDENAKARTEAEKKQITYDTLAEAVLQRMKEQNKAQQQNDQAFQDALDKERKKPQA